MILIEFSRFSFYFCLFVWLVMMAHRVGWHDVYDFAFLQNAVNATIHC